MRMHACVRFPVSRVQEQPGAAAAAFGSRAAQAGAEPHRSASERQKLRDAEGQEAGGEVSGDEVRKLRFW